MTRKIILRNAQILRPGENLAFIKRGDIYVDGAKIVAVEGEGQPFTDSTADEIVDLPNCAVHPGFINTHTHTPLTYLRGLAQDVGLADFFGCLAPHAHLLSKEHAYWSSMLAQIEMIRNGITTFVDACEWMDEVGRAAQRSGLRAVLGSEIDGIRPLDGAAQDLAYTIGDSQFIWDDDYGMQRLSEGLRDIAASRALNCSRLTNYLNPHAIYSCSPTLLQEIARGARELELPVSLHFAEDEEIETQIRIRHGSSVNLLKKSGLLDRHCLGVHCIYLDANEIQELEGTSFAVSHCLGSNLKLGEKIAPI